MSAVSAKIFYVITLSFAGGVALASFFSLGISGGMFFALLGALAGFFSRASGRKSLALVGVGVLSFGLGMARMSAVDVRDYALDSFVGEKIIVEGVIDDEADRRENSLLLTFLPKRLTPPPFGHLPLAGEEEKILLITDRLAPFEYGDRVRVEGKLILPENFTTENAREFDYVSYLAKDGIHYRMSFAKITLINHGEGSWMKEKLFATKKAFLESINRAIPEPEAGLLGGILLGAKHSLGKDLLEDFRTTGLVHIVVLSGYNITLVVDWTMRLLAFLPRMYGLLAGGAFTFFFVLMTGANAATVRAGMMAIIVLSARHMGREAESVRLLFFVAFLMILWSPAALLSDPSFQLSVAATFGLLTLSSKISEKLKPLHLFRGGGREGVSREHNPTPTLPSKEVRGQMFRTIASDTLATQIAVLPLLLWMTGTLSLAALPANLLTLPAVPPAMFFGFFTGLFGLASYLLAFPFAAVAHILLSYIFLVAEFFASFPFASLTLP